MIVSGFSKDSLCLKIDFGFKVFICLVAGLRTVLFIKRSSFFYYQFIGGYVLRRKPYGRFKAFNKAGLTVAGYTADKVYIYVFKARGTKNVKSFYRGFRIMGTSQRFKHLIIKGLNAHADSVDSRLKVG